MSRAFTAPYHHDVSSAGLVVVALGGVLLGWLACLLVYRRPVPPTNGRPTGETSLESEVLRASTTGYVVTNDVGRPLLSNARASELAVLRAGILDPDIVSAVARVTASGESVDVELRPVRPPTLTSTGNPPSAVLAVVRPIGEGRMLVAATDESASRRMEAARRDFVANVSHELKTPVAAIGLLAEAALGSADDPLELRRFVARLQTESVRLGALVNELITLSRLQGADPMPDAAVVQVDAVVEETIARVSTAAENAGIAVISDRPSGLLIRGDKAQLTTALTNLVENAINYSPTGTQVSVSRALRDGLVQVSVTDRGIGIAPEYTERVFERFFRIDPARSRATGGTGLGLAIVKHVAANHGGSATVWSRPGTGSTFTLQLPALEQPESARGEPESRGPSSAPEPAHRGGL